VAENKIGSGIPLKTGEFYDDQNKRTVTGWRIEINRRQKAGGDYKHHWIYRITLDDGGRKSSYGGRVVELELLDPGRVKQYHRNSRRHARRFKR
jgi:hypothetical protein